MTAPAAAAHITIWLDNASRRLPAGTTLAALVAELGHAEQAVSTAVNGRFTSRSARAQCVLADGDQVLLFQPIVGG